MNKPVKTIAVIAIAAGLFAAATAAQADDWHDHELRAQEWHRHHHMHHRHGHGPVIVQEPNVVYAPPVVIEPPPPPDDDNAGGISITVPINIH